jgi:LPS sulfotransferase NodH
MDKYFKGEPNTFKEHPNYNEWNYEFEDRRMPTVEDVQELFTGKSQ